MRTRRREFPRHEHRFHFEKDDITIEDGAAIAVAQCEEHQGTAEGYKGERVPVGERCPAEESIRHDPEYISVGGDTFYLDDDEDYRDIPLDSKFGDCLGRVEESFRDGSLDDLNFDPRRGAAEAQVGDCYVNFGL